MALAREDPRMAKLRQDIFAAISRTLELWSTDASVSDVSDTFVLSNLYIPSRYLSLSSINRL